MSVRRGPAIARHVEAAQRLLQQLEEHADAARHALGEDDGEEFFAAVDARDELLGALDEVVTEIAHHRAASPEPDMDQERATTQLLTEMAQAAARALESHEQLAVQARRERDRLGSALARADRPDSVASQYAVSTNAARTLSFSVTG